MEYASIGIYLAVAAFFAVMVWLDGRPKTNAFHLVLAIALWPASILVVLLAVIVAMVLPPGAERHYLPGRAPAKRLWPIPSPERRHAETTPQARQTPH